MTIPFFFFSPGAYKTGVGRFPIEKSQTKMFERVFSSES